MFREMISKLIPNHQNDGKNDSLPLELEFNRPDWEAGSKGEPIYSRENGHFWGDEIRYPPFLMSPKDFR
jgi:hypothetical protein